MDNLKWLFKFGVVTVEQLGGGLDKLNFAVRSPEGFFIWQLSDQPLNSERSELLEKLAVHMGRRGIATRHLVAPSMTILRQSAFRWMAVYRGVAGQSIPWSDYSEPQIISAVRYLARIHEAGRSFAGRNSLARLSKKLDRRSEEATDSAGSDYRVNLGALAQIKTRLAALNCDQAAATVLHGDFGRANIIFQGECVSGVVDFDRAVFGHPLFDLGRFTSYLLLDTSLPGADIGQSICQTYQLVNISPSDLQRATEWSWWTDWLSWRKTSSDLRGKLENKLITSGIIEPI